MLLPDDQGHVAPRYGAAAFAADARERLPPTTPAADLVGVHATMAALADAARRAIATGDLPALRRLSAFVAAAAGRPDADPEIENAVAVSFLEPDDLAGPHGPAAWDALPERLRTLVRTPDDAPLPPPTATWTDALDAHGYNVVADELAWHLREGRRPTGVVKRTSPETGVQFTFADQTGPLLRVSPLVLERTWTEAVQIVGWFPEVQPFAFRDR